MWKLSDDYFSMAEGILLLEDSEYCRPLVVHCAHIAPQAAE